MKKAVFWTIGYLVITLLIVLIFGDGPGYIIALWLLGAFVVFNLVMLRAEIRDLRNLLQDKDQKH